MNRPPSNGQPVWLAMLGRLARWLLGGVFIWFGVSKAQHPVEFLKLIRQYELTQNPQILDAIAALLPWFEVACGVLLVVGIAVRGTALVSLALLIPFTIAVFHRALVLKSASGLSLCLVKFDCGCGNGAEFVCRKLIENVFLIGLSAWLLLRGKGKKRPENLAGC